MAREPNLMKIILCRRAIFVSDGLFDLSRAASLFTTGTSPWAPAVLHGAALCHEKRVPILCSRKPRRRPACHPFETEIKSLGRRDLSGNLDVRSHDSIRENGLAAEAAFGHVDIPPLIMPGARSVSRRWR